MTAWPPNADEAPTPDDVLDTLSDLFIHGTETYRRSEPRRDLLAQLQQRLEGPDYDLLLAYEAHTNQLADLWGEDRFRIGFALGVGLGRLVGR